jgi:hypothetical protein
MPGQRPAYGTIVLLASAAVACVPGLAGFRDENIRAEHGAALLEGYEAYETLMSDTDTDIVWFEYRLPQHVVVADVPAKIARRIATRDPSFRIAESSAGFTRTRCPDETGTAFMEYLVGVVPQERVVFIMHAAINGGAEQKAYPRVKEFQDEVLARSNRR